MWSKAHHSGRILNNLRNNTNMKLQKIIHKIQRWNNLSGNGENLLWEHQTTFCSSYLMGFSNLLDVKWNTILVLKILPNEHEFYTTFIFLILLLISFLGFVYVSVISNHIQEIYRWDKKVWLMNYKNSISVLVLVK